MIELHDSKVESIRIDDKNLVLVFSEAYVHQSQGRPGLDRGTGWAQRIQLEFFRASLDGIPKALPDRISDGEFTVGKTAGFGIRLPFESNEPVLVSLIFQSGNEIQIFGERLTVIEHGPARFVEDFPKLSLHVD